MNHLTRPTYLTCWTIHQCPTRNNLTHHAPRTTYPALTHHAPRPGVMNQLPNSEIIIIGGGAIGCGVAYALAKAGQTDILLIERAGDVGQITTSQGAGLCGQARDTAERIKLAMTSVSVFRELQRSEVKPDWHEVGSLRIALSDERAKEFRQLKRAADDAGLEAGLIDNA